MSEYRIVFVNQDPAPSAPKVPDVPSREQIRNQIRQSIQDATRHSGQTQPAAFPNDVIPPQAVDISIAFFIMVAVILIGWPLARAFGRRLERRADVPALPDPAMSGQLQRIEQAVEAMSIEIERISESQRFMAKLQNGATPERSALGTGERR